MLCRKGFIQSSLEEQHELDVSKKLQISMNTSGLGLQALVLYKETLTSVYPQLSRPEGNCQCNSFSIDL